MCSLATSYKTQYSLSHPKPRLRRDSESIYRKTFIELKKFKVKKKFRHFICIIMGVKQTKCISNLSTVFTRVRITDQIVVLPIVI